MRGILPVIFTCITFFSGAQFNNTPTGFVRHLLNKKMYEEAIVVLKEKLGHAPTLAAKDSTRLFLGRTYYNLQQLQPSIEHFDAVSRAQSTLHLEATFFSAFNEAYQKNPKAARQKLLALNVDGQSQHLKNFELAGISLLEGNLPHFDSLHQTLAKEWPVIQQQQKNLLAYRNELRIAKQKSMLLAGSLSALVPGVGKIYAGRKGNGLYTFLITSLLGAQAYEAYRKDGVKSARFIIYGSLFTSFYIGNIWGSALAVKVVKNERKDAIQSQILFDMHIPLRTIFQ